MSDTGRGVTGQLDALFPPRGPCGFCCEGDARHRLLDAVVSRSRAGESVDDLAADYGVSREAVAVVLAEWRYEEEGS